MAITQVKFKKITLQYFDDPNVINRHKMQCVFTINFKSKLL